MNVDEQSEEKQTSTVGTSANGRHKNDGDELNELKKENVALKAQVQVLLTENKQLVKEKKIQEDKCNKLVRSLEENNLKEIAELKLKNQKLTEENKAFEEKLKKLEKIVQINQQKISETQNEIMLPMHEMKVQLPLENWHDLLAFVPRSQLGNVVSQIGDRQFAHIIQSFLHDEVRKITLGKMEIIPPRRGVSSDFAMVRVGLNEATNMPDWPMPGNIKDFGEIDLNYLDTSVLNFLEKFQENSLLTGVNMFFDFKLRRSHEDILLQVLTQIKPFITSIDSIASLLGIDLFEMVCNNTNHGNSHSQLLLKEMITQTRILIIHPYYDADPGEFECSWEDIENYYFFWLNTPRNDGKPRMLKSDHPFYATTCCNTFIERIKKDFEMANNPVSFFIYIRIYWKINIEDISFENVKTPEKLVIKTKMDGDKWKKLLISRYPLNAAKCWIEANEKEIYEWDPEKLNRKINLGHDLAIPI